MLDLIHPKEMPVYLLAVVMPLPGSLAFGQTRVVRHDVATTGSDANPGTREQPFATPGTQCGH